MQLQHKHKFAGLVLAAGKGTRMRSSLPKVMHRLAGQPMVSHVLQTLLPLSPSQVVLVVAPGMESVREQAATVLADCAFAVQEEQLGTGHAVKIALKALDDTDIVLVLYGDTPLVTTETLASLLDQKAQHKAVIALLAMQPGDPTGYGRLSMKQEPFVERIIEHKDASEAERQLRWVWGGMMAFDAAFLRKAIAELKPSPVTGEYYLTSLIEMADAQGLRSVMVPMAEEEAMGVNDRVQLAQAEAVLQRRLRERAMLAGATLVDPETIYLSADTLLGRDVVVHPHVVFGRKVRIEEGAEIRSFSHIEGATIGERAIVGPFARLRPGSVLGEASHVGNFVELKNTRLGKGAKANHLSYVGDSDVGEAANIGAGTITCNYDGYNKHKTVIGAHAFIGSNSSLVAPVTIGAGAIVGAGSVVTENVEADALVVTRAQQVNKPDKAKQIRQKKQKNG